MIHVDYNPGTGRFIIHAPFHALALMRAIPNRKFEKKLDNAWTAPALRANAQYLMEALPTQAVFTPEAKAKMRDVLEPQAPPELPFPTDYQFKTEPFDHQMMALNASYSKRSFALFMDMRTGKTKVIIDLALAYFKASLIDRLVLVPMLTLRRNWEAEFRVHARDDEYEGLMLDTGLGKRFLDFSKPGSGKLKVLYTGIESMSAGRAIDMVLEFCGSGHAMGVIDESDTIKNHKSIRTQNMCLIRDKCDFRLIMTGTPIAKGPMDFYSQFEFLDPNIVGIGDWYSFRNRYAIMGGYEDKEIVGYQNMSELTELIKPFVYQVRYDAVFKSPPSVKELRTVQMSDEQKSYYKTMKKDNTIRFDEKDADGNRKIALIAQNVLEKMLRLQEVTGGIWAERIDTGKFKITEDKFGQIKKPTYKYNHHRIKGKNPKIEALVDVLTREYADDQGIVWAIHIEELMMINEALSPFGKVALFHGDVPENERHQIDQDFRAGKVKWIVANPTTGGRGYTFDAAMVMVNYSSSFSYIKRQQSLERATSNKKTKPVVIVDIIAENSVDEVILEALQGCHDVSEYVRSALAGRKRGVDELLLG